jgi:hypothetical protein
MKKNLRLKVLEANDIHCLLKKESGSLYETIRVYSRIGNYLKIILFSGLLFGSALLFNSCVGYVSSEPSYVEYERPTRPGPAYIWIDGGWHWDYHRHVYIQRPGYWERPRVGRAFVSGHWQNTPRGKRWVEGHWQRQGDEREHRER